MKPIREMSQIELAAFVQSNLLQRGMEFVLSGGAAVTIYSGDKYVSLDIDLVPLTAIPRKRIAKAMAEMGFSQQGRHFTHPESPYFVEFPAGPLAIGSQPVYSIEEKVLPTGVLKVISATDCVKDRLSAYYHWGDLQALEQAKLVANQGTIDLHEVERWSVVEGKSEEFNRVREALAGKRF
ncbi:MAG: hypothetical protein HYZ26_05535 [Chloroflexi bacterium]|nr:hypothetical protein [Chloroflexota bacterium]